MKLKNTIIALFTLFSLTISPVSAFAESSVNPHLAARYSSGMTNEDGGVTEIVAYNEKNKVSYVVNGSTGNLDIIDMKAMKDGESYLTAESIDVRTLISDEMKKHGKKYPFLSDFVYGDMTSVDVDPQKNAVAIAVQAEDPDKNGIAVILDHNGKILTIVPVGKQPDMLTFTEKGKYLLIANEGEPRNGYAEGTSDPEGSVTVVDMSQGYGTLSKKGVTTVGFEAFDGDGRESLIKNGVILKKGSQPSEDLEPEFIAADKNERYAYVALQEANAIAVLDLESLSYKGIYGLGFKDFSASGNEIDVLKDKKIDIRNENLSGIYMPDGITVYENNGETYLLTANEGDSREWGDYLNEKSVKIDGNKVTAFDTSDYDGLFENNRNYLFGARSFSMLKVTDSGLERVYDSGSDFERITAERLPEYFNASNNDTKLDSRSGKKGPEPENVVTGTVDGRTYAFIGLERIGGVMVYDITDPSDVTFTDYIISRDYSEDIAGDVAPEGLCFVDAKDSITGLPLLLSANEVSGTVAVYSIK